MSHLPFFLMNRLNKTRVCCFQTFDAGFYKDLFFFSDYCLLCDFYVRRWLCIKSRTSIITLEIIVKRGIIARLSNNTSFRLYEKVCKCRFFNIFNFLAATQKATASFTYKWSQNKIIFMKTMAKNDPPLW